MMLTYFFIELRCPDFNELIAAAKIRSGHGNWNAYADTKLKYTSDVAQLIRQYYRRLGIPTPSIAADQRVLVRFDWYEADRRRDPDNLAGGGRKIILDAARSVGVIAHDGWRLYAEGALAIQEAFHLVARPNQKVGVLVSFFTQTPQADQPHAA